MTQIGKILAATALFLSVSHQAMAQAQGTQSTFQSPLKKKSVNLDSQTGNLPLPKQETPEEMAEKKPEMPTVSGVREGTRLVEKFSLERVPVYPDDPESAWWEANPRTAFALAQRQQRPLLLLFTAGWNAKCMALSEEVFTTKTFNDYVKDKVVICYLDYARSKTDNPDAMRQWKEDFKVMGYPNLLVFDPEGNVVQDLTGYHTGRPVSYFNELKNIVDPVIRATDEQKEGLRLKGFRDWRNTEGTSLFARFVKWGGDLVTLQSADQRLWTIDLSTLAEDDQKFVRSFPTVGEVAAGIPESR